MGIRLGAGLKRFDYDDSEDADDNITDSGGESSALVPVSTGSSPAPEYPEGEARERIERLVWAGLGVKPVRQIADETGISPDEVFRIKRELLEAVDVLSITEKRQKLLVELESMARDARERAERMPDEFFAGAVNSSVSAIKAMQAELSRMSKDDNERIVSLNALRVRELVSLMQDTVELGVGRVVEQFGLDGEALFEIFNSALVEAASKRDVGV